MEIEKRLFISYFEIIIFINSAILKVFNYEEKTFHFNIEYKRN